MMSALIVDPLTYDKTIAYATAVEMCKTFLDINSVSQPEYVPNKSPHSGKWKDFGMYDSATKKVWVNLKKSRPPTRTPGFAWTFTGYKADLTAPGIVAHETGHHLHCESGITRRTIQAAFANELPVSGYEPHPGESFAEAVRLFILNPSLLLEGRPRRFDFLMSVVKVRPTHMTPWRDVLQHAHPRIIAAAETWIARKS